MLPQAKKRKKNLNKYSHCVALRYKSSSQLPVIGYKYYQYTVAFQFPFASDVQKKKSCLICFEFSIFVIN